MGLAIVSTMSKVRQKPYFIRQNFNLTPVIPSNVGFSRSPPYLDRRAIGRNRSKRLGPNSGSNWFRAA